jgi:hypothetical protein
MWENFRKLHGLTLSKASTNLMRIVGEMPRKPSKVSRPNKQRSTVCGLECGKSWMASAKSVEAPRMSTTTACEIDLEKLLIRGNETSSDVNGLSSIERCLMMTSQKTWRNSQGELWWNEVQSGWRTFQYSHFYAARNFANSQPTHHDVRRTPATLTFSLQNS